MRTIRSNLALDKKLKRLKSNAALLESYERAVDRLSESEDPANLGKRLRGKYAAHYEYRLPGSYRLVYRIDRAAKLVVLYKVGDHKELFGRDNR